MSVFGWNCKKLQNFGPIKREKCNNCGNEATFQLQKMTTYITLFEFPIIPYRINYLLVCPICKNYQEIESSEFYEFVDHIQSKKEAENPMISSDNYVTQNGSIYRTETQLNFIKQMKEIEMERERKIKEKS